MKLSKRLQMNVSLVPKGARVADIGCDHGYASIWLVTHSVSEKVIALDVNRGPIERAGKHVRDAGLEKKIECRQSDGTESLIPGEVDTLMLAGMGGPLMTDILAAGSTVLEQVNTLILQPQSDFSIVRRFVLEHGFCITMEKACIDDGKYYFAIRAERGKSTGRQCIDQEWQYRYGTYLVQKRDPVLREYLLKKQDTYRSILKNLGQSDAGKERLTEIEHRISDIERCLAHME